MDRFAGAICGNIVGRNLVHRVVVHAALGIDVRFAGAICGNIVGRNLVHRVVVHAVLGNDVLVPWAELPLAAIIGARAEP